MLTHQQTGGRRASRQNSTVQETLANTRTTVPATRPRHRELTVVGAIVAAVAVWVVSGFLFGGALQVVQAGATQTGGVGAVVAAAAIPALLGWALLAGLERFTRRPKTIWTAVAVLVTVLSLGGP